MNVVIMRLVAVLLAVGAASTVWAQNSNPVQNAINRDLMNRKILEQAQRERGQTPVTNSGAIAAPLLYGRWLPMIETNQLATHGIGHGGCAFTMIIWTATTEIYETPGLGPYPAEKKTNRVAYVRRNRNSFFVVPAGSTSGNYVEIIDHDHVRPESADMCVYRRAG